jgi:hypothetical protein
MKIVFTGTSARTVANWQPALSLLQDRGHIVQSICFPHRPDPDSEGLQRIGFPNLMCVPVEIHFSILERSSAKSIADKALHIIRDTAPDILMLTTCHAGPEAELMSLLALDKKRPVILGCQHGIVQNWNGYWSNFCFDYLLVFGPRFALLTPPHLRDRVISAALPKLDLFTKKQRGDFDNDQRPILFVAQTVCTPKLVKVLVDLSYMSGRQLLVRPHPEFRNAFDNLRPFATFLDVLEPLEAQMAAASLIITTGSTAALEAVTIGIPVVVLPQQRGNEYEAAGIVAKMDVADILRLAKQQLLPEYRAQLLTFLENASGSRTSNRSVIAADCIEVITTQQQTTKAAIARLTS